MTQEETDMSDWTIKVQFPTDRWQTGTVALVNAQGKTAAGPFKSLGKASNAAAAAHLNPARDPLQPFGDTPTGGYRVVQTIATGAGTNYPAYNYGASGAIVLDPVSGDAVTAKANGRRGLLIHGGAPGTGGRLRATHGCIRLSDGDMAALIAAIGTATTNPIARRCEAITLSVIVGDPADDTAGPGMDDPPPGIDDLLNSPPLP